MALAATESFSGGFVRDPQGRLVTVTSAGGALAAGEQLSGGFVRDADGRLMIIASPGGALAAGEQISGGFVRDAVGRLSTVTSGAAFPSGGFVRDGVGRLVITAEASGALPAGDYFSGGFLRDATGNLVTTSGGGGGGNTYTAAVLADSPVAYYRLGDAGATAPDQMGGPNGAYSGATAQAANLLPTQAGASTNFTGGQVNVPDSPASRLGAGAFSIEAWINFPAFVAWMALIDEASRAYTLLFTGDSAHWFVGAGGSASSGPNVGATLAAGQTYHVVVTVDAGNNFVSYINGTPASSTLGGHGATNSSTGFVIGGNPSGGGGPFSGRIQELALYNTVLSAARVAAHYAAA